MRSGHDRDEFISKRDSARNLLRDSIYVWCNCNDDV